jgi:hypothetical protein
MPGLVNINKNLGAASIKVKLRQWLEVKIGSKWYVIGAYSWWHVILHLKFDAGIWKLDPANASDCGLGEGEMDIKNKNTAKRY